ncbi:hypothetical protein INS49_004602 [Diaporthe citri]|uniref:uncharacterized protein n=1 Tax=Diaporthe citri TaxID=83186 RepID=UPI001C7EF9EC|nr:uncharacterized protein INS49_004602 [Diaporthe citri]KAG6354584.1 hypothetical protein INS49_004602 [Diaporthe citri]
MSHSEDNDQPLNFGSDLSIKACIQNCLGGEFCDCDHHRENFDDPGGQPASAPYQQPTAREPLLSVASSAQGPSQPRQIVQQYQPVRPMNYGSNSYAGQGNPRNHAGHGGSYAGHPASEGGYLTTYGGVFIAPQHPPGFTTQGSSYQEGRDVTPLQESRGWFRDHAGRLYNGLGEHINERGEVIQPAASSVPQSSPRSGLSGDESGRTAPSHRSDSSAHGSRAGSHHGHHHGNKQKNH